MTIMKERLASFEYNGEPVALIPARMQPIALNEYEQTMPDGLRVRLTVDGYEGGASRVLDELKRTQAIEADADYDVILSDEQLNAERKTLSGRALKSLVVRADRPRSSLLIEYKKHGTQHI